MKQLPSIIYTNANLVTIMTCCCQKELMEISDEVHMQAFPSSITLSTLFDRTVTR
jgi:bifunctional pyridoxal-dependent enzyme with beta-cystathionase and maltose regulon repressor activities